MTPREKRAATSLAGIYALRMLGLFMILPVFSLYAETLEGVTPLLVGVAIGIYGLTQAAFQIPFGMLSDRFGRKPIIALGLLIFAIGSVVAAMADTMTGVIIGRALQGAGAIAAVIMALTADLTREEHRVKAMAVIGGTIGFSFAVALISGPIINAVIGVDGIFWVTAVLAIGGIFVLYKIVPDPGISRFHRDSQPVTSQFKNVLKNPELLRLDAGIFILHMVLTASFVVMPFALRDFAHMESDDHWQIYLPVLLISMVIMVPFIIVAEKRRRIKQIMSGAVLVLAVAEFLLMVDHYSPSSIFFALLIFFIAFNMMEPLLQSMISKVAKVHQKGTAIGMANTFAYIGTFLGAVLAGSMLRGGGDHSSLWIFAMIGIAWFAWTLKMQNPIRHSHLYLNLADVNMEKLNSLEHDGVAEWYINDTKQLAVVKYQRDAINEENLRNSLLN